MQIGVIAEETNDVDVLYELTRKLIPENAFSFSRFVGHGSGKLRRKVGVWAENLLTRGCSYLVVIHDRDQRDEAQLRALLCSQLESSLSRVVILIPIEEIEAWLLCDPTALQTVFKMGRVPTIPARPEGISDPKEFLSRIVAQNSRSQYLNTVHNRRIAAALGIDALKKRCPSFERFPKFIDEVMKKGRARKRRVAKRGSKRHR